MVSLFLVVVYQAGDSAGEVFATDNHVGKVVEPEGLPAMGIEPMGVVYSGV